jgi:ATP-dependent protease HslVU (ClpYQ) peptidase subunit
MTTIAVVRKGRYCAIAADTLTKWGHGKEGADYIANHDKIQKVGDTYLAITGTTTFKTIARDYFGGRGVRPRFDSPIEIFRTWQRFHAVLKDRYFLQPTEDKDDALESSRMDVLFANPHGIFGIAAHRTVQEYSKFYAFGSGGDIALGTMYALYGVPGCSAEDIARRAIEAAAEFNDATGLPATSHAVKLR